MPTPPLTDEDCRQAIELAAQFPTLNEAAQSIGKDWHWIKRRLNLAARRGLMGTEPVLEGFRISKTTAVYDANGNLARNFVQQKPESGDKFEMPEGHGLKGVSAYLDAQGNVIGQWVKTGRENEAQAWREALDEFKAELPPIERAVAPVHTMESLLAQYTVTDLHMGMLADEDETRDANWDIGIAERLLLDWFSAAIEMAPAAHTAVFAQLGDLAHYDSMRSETPEHRNMLDADSRPHKMVRAIIRIIRRVIPMLLAKHERVHVIIAKANHDPYSSIWLREILASMFEDEPRLTVDTSPSEYYAYEFGETALFYHHGHRRNVKDVDSVFAGMFREMFGRCKHARLSQILR